MNAIGMNRLTQERWDITQIEDPKSVIPKDLLVCPHCRQPMQIRHGLIRMKHFAHETRCTDMTPRHPESREHLLGKEYVAFICRQVHPTASVDLEVKVAAANRIADIFVTYENGWQEVHEIQLSSITTGEIQERTSSYQSAGIDVHWWLGLAANTPSNQRWIANQFGGISILRFAMVDARETVDHITNVYGVADHFMHSPSWKLLPK